MANTPNINLVKPLGTDRALVSVINDNSDKIDAFAGSANTNMANTQNGYAIVVDGNNAPKAITAGQYLFIKNHSTLSTGGYHATANIANGAAITSSNVAADADGVVNGAFAALNGKIGNIGGLIARNTTPGSTMSGTLDLANAHAIIAVIDVHNVGDISMVIPLDGTQNVYGHIKYNDDFWASVKLQLTASNGQYAISFDAKGARVSTFNYAYFYRL